MMTNIGATAGVGLIKLGSDFSSWKLLLLLDFMMSVNQTEATLFTIKLSAV